MNDQQTTSSTPAAIDAQAITTAALAVFDSMKAIDLIDVPTSQEAYAEERAWKDSLRANHAELRGQFEAAIPAMIASEQPRSVCLKWLWALRFYQQFLLDHLRAFTRGAIWARHAKIRIRFENEGPDWISRPLTQIELPGDAPPPLPST